MKPGSNRRPRSRPNNNNNKRQGGRNSYDSNGPDGKVRGTAQQVLEKYQALGRDATSAGDRIAAEAYFQFAEHYYRLVNADGGQQNQRQERQPEPTPSAENEPSGNVAAESGSAEPPVEVVNVPIMPGPIEAPAGDAKAKRGNEPSEQADAAQKPQSDSDKSPKEKAKPVRRRRPRVKTDATDEAAAESIEA